MPNMPRQSHGIKMPTQVKTQPAKVINDYLKPPTSPGPPGFIAHSEDSQTTHKSSTAPSQVNKYDSRWLNKELVGHINLLQNDQIIVSQIQMYEKLPYSKDKFTYWMNKNGNMPHTQDLFKKRNEIFESKLITQGLNIKNWPFIIFLLKNNHNYTDVKEINDNHNYQFNVTRGLKPQKTRKIIDATPR